MRNAVRIVLALLTILAISHLAHPRRVRAAAGPITAAGCGAALVEAGSEPATMAPARVR